jgi:maleylpyruvate isomerase
MSGSVFGGQVPVTEMAHCVAAHQRLLFTLQQLDDTTATSPSLVPKWTRAHVVAHLAVDAESNVRMLRGLLRDETIPQYAGGAGGHRRAIEEIVGLKPAGLVDHYRTASEDLFAVWQELPDDRWERAVRTLGGSSPAADTAWIRWHELEVRHVDLDLGFQPDDWPAAYVTTALVRLLEGLPAPGRAGAPKGLWVIEATDRERIWSVDTGDSASPSVEDGTPSRAADGYIAGAAHVVLAWLLGRPVAGDQLRVEGSRSEEAWELPRWFPVL